MSASRSSCASAPPRRLPRRNEPAPMSPISPSPAARAIPVLDLRAGGPVAHAEQRRDAMLALREACFSVVPTPLRSVALPLDRISRAWLRRSPSPYVAEIARIAAIAVRPGVWFVNASYEWGCTTRIDVEPAPFLRRTLDWPFPGLGRHVEVALQDGGAGPYASLTWPGAVGRADRGRARALRRRDQPGADVPAHRNARGLPGRLPAQRHRHLA